MLRKKLSKFNIILASGSPRRQRFLKELDIPFTIELKEVEEVYPKHWKGAAITDYLADLKSKPFTDLKDKWSFNYIRHHCLVWGNSPWKTKK